MENNPNTQTIYATGHSKVMDFCIGFFGTILLFTIAGFISNPLYEFLPHTNDLFLFFPSIAALIASIYAISKYKKMNRRYVSIGIIISLVTPIIAAGACFVIFMGLGGF
ncbi:hypothetical protein KJ918_00845 [Patescibacteria group bacterium]|nr:hypothetical protein [Patescibacteria group bacterium]MBU0975322.1 hypothetical protein [Patescibacteria group bacterium]